MEQLHPDDALEVVANSNAYHGLEESAIPNQQSTKVSSRDNSHPQIIEERIMRALKISYIKTGVVETAKKRRGA